MDLKLPTRAVVADGRAGWIRVLGPDGKPVA